MCPESGSVLEYPELVISAYESGSVLEYPELVINAYKKGLEDKGKEIQATVDALGMLTNEQKKTNELLKQAVKLLGSQNKSHDELRNDIKRIQDREEIKRQDLIYEKYAKKLEKEHAGEYVAIGPDGKTIVEEDDIEVGKKALEEFGEGNFVFRIIGCRYVEALI